MRADYTGMTWDDVRADSELVHAKILRYSSVSVSTPALGLGDNYRASSVVRDIYENYGIRPTINCYHPYLFENNPMCIVGTDVLNPNNIVLDTIPYRKQPENGYYNGRMLTVSDQYCMDVGLFGVVSCNHMDFYPTQAEIVWGIVNLSRYEPYITIQSQCDPPRRYYNISPNLQRSDSNDRWMTIGDWYSDRWVSLVSEINSIGYNVVQIGCQYDEYIPGAVDMREVGVRNTFTVVGRSRLLVCHESFPQFVSNAMDVPTVLIMTGRSSLDGTQFPNVITVDKSANCDYAPCFNIELPVDSYCPRICMDMIAVSDIMDAIEETFNVQ